MIKKPIDWKKIRFKWNEIKGLVGGYAVPRVDLDVFYLTDYTPLAQRYLFFKRKDALFFFWFQNTITFILFFKSGNLLATFEKRV